MENWSLVFLMKKASTVRSAVNHVVGLSFIAVIGLYVASYVTAEDRVNRLCEDMRPAMIIDDLNKYAVSVGLDPPARATGTSFLVERKTFGRYGCKVEAVDGIVRSVEFYASN